MPTDLASKGIHREGEIVVRVRDPMPLTPIAVRDRLAELEEQLVSALRRIAALETRERATDREIGELKQAIESLGGEKPNGK